MEKYISPAKSDSIAEVQNQLNQFVSVASMSESLISSNLMRGIFNLSFKSFISLIYLISLFTIVSSNILFYAYNLFISEFL